MTFRAWALAGTASIMGLSASVSARAQVPDPQASESQLTTGPASVFARPVDQVPPLDDRAREALRRAIKNDQRIDVQRDRWRNPEATLQFFGVLPSDTVVEIWPGQGWYTSILGPYLKQGDGKLIVGHFDAAASNSQVVRQIVDAYRARFAADKGVYGNVNVIPFGSRSMPMVPPNSVDKVLTFRNIHNWMAQGWTEKAFADFYILLKPGGILGIEEHRGRTDEPQDPLARDGYVREDYVIQLAREAGFEFIGGAEINANPADTKDHPFGVWTLPPVSRTSPIGQIDDPGFDRRRYDDIGESDRMTLRFRKPLDATGVGLASSRPTADQIPVTIIPSPPPPPRRGRRGAPPPPPSVPPVLAGVESKPDAAGAAAPVDPKAAAVAPTAGLRPATQDPQAKAPPPLSANARRGSNTKGRTPSPATAPVAPASAEVPSNVGSPEPAGDIVPPSATPNSAPKAAAQPAGTAAPTPLRARQRGATPATSKATEATNAASATTSKPKSAPPSARDAEAIPTASPSARPRARSSTVAPSEEARPETDTPASRKKAGEEAPSAANRRTSPKPAAEPAKTKTPPSKTKSKTKESQAETKRPASSRSKNRPETETEGKKKTSAKASSKNSAKAAPKARPAKKSPPTAKANPDKPDWVVPPKKKN